MIIPVVVEGVLAIANSSKTARKSYSY